MRSRLAGALGWMLSALVEGRLPLVQSSRAQRHAVPGPEVIRFEFHDQLANLEAQARIAQQVENGGLLVVRLSRTGVLGGQFGEDLQSLPQIAIVHPLNALVHLAAGGGSLLVQPALPQSVCGQAHRDRILGRQGVGQGLLGAQINQLGGGALLGQRGARFQEPF